MIITRDNRRSRRACERGLVQLLFAYLGVSAGAFVPPTNPRLLSQVQTKSSTATQTRQEKSMVLSRASSTRMRTCNRVSLHDVVVDADDNEATVQRRCNNHFNENHVENPTNSFLLGLSSLWLAAMLLAFHPLPAHAGFGPSSGATTSPPPGLSRPLVQEKDVETDSKRIKILIESTLDEGRLDAFSEQLDGLIEFFQQRQQQQQGQQQDREEQEQQERFFATTQAELERIRLLQIQLRQREELLDKLQAQPYWFNYLAAFIGSVASTLVMHPIDTIKTRTMIGNEEEEEDDDDKTEASLMETLASLYEGLTGNIFKEGPPSALYLGVYETVKYSLVPKTSPEALLLVYLTAGAAGEMVGSLVRAPAEAIKSVVQAETAQTTWQAVQLCFGSAEGRQNVVRAWSASVLRDVPFGCLNLALFETVKAYILNNPDISIDSSTLLSEAIIGAFAGGCGALVTNPMDVVTTRIITQEATPSSEHIKNNQPQQTKPLGVVGMTQKLYQEGGFSIFMKGWRARVGYWAPAISLFLTVYCSVRQAGVRYDIFG